MDAKPTVFNVELPSFSTDVVERSKEVPVVLLFWTDEIPPAADTKRHLEALASQYQGKFALALCDVAQTPELAQQLRVQGIPSIRVIANGQIAHQLDGPQGEAVLRQMIDELTMSGSERLKEGLGRFIAIRDWEGALALIRQALTDEPNNASFRVELADLLQERAIWTTRASRWGRLPKTPQSGTGPPLASKSRRPQRLSMAARPVQGRNRVRTTSMPYMTPQSARRRMKTTRRLLSTA